MFQNYSQGSKTQVGILDSDQSSNMMQASFAAIPDTKIVD